MKPYENYIDTKEYWLGKIPEHWKIIRLKLIGSINKGKKPINDYDKYEEGLFPYLSMEYLRGKSNDPIYANPNEGNLLVVNEGDIIILWDGSNAGEIVRAKTGVLSSTMAKIELKSDEFFSSFLNYYLQIAQVHIQNNTIGMGIPHVNGNVLRDLLLSIPPLNEQIQIAAFLDKKTALIDEIISKKERLIELLQAKRQATINEVVTGKKVWDATTQEWKTPKKVKHTDIEWLGEIPAEWEVVKLKYLGECQNGVSAGSEYFGSGSPFVSYGDVYRNIELPKSVSGLANSTIEDKKSYSVIEGDVFFTRTSETIEEIGIASTCLETIENAVFAGFLIRFRPTTKRIFKGFSKYYFRCYVPRVHFVKEMNLVTRASLNQDLLKSLPVILPSIKEQEKISNILENEDTVYNSLLLKLTSQIQKLKDYRQSLISEVVTGKIDVTDSNIK